MLECSHKPRTVKACQGGLDGSLQVRRQGCGALDVGRVLRAIESQSWPKVVAIALATAVVAYAIFGWLLGIPLPVGALGI